MNIAIVGAHPRTRLLAPFGDARWRIFSCSSRNVDTLPRHDAWFELHTPAFMERDPEEYPGWLKKQPMVYMLEKYDGFPGAVEYPRKAMVDEFGPYFFTSTISYMLALALSQKPEALGIFGVETESSAEYAYQRSSHHHFIQLARDRSIEIVTAPISNILKPPGLYGYDSVLVPQ